MRWDHVIMFLGFLQESLSNGRASGRLRFQERWHFLCGLWPFEEF